MKELGKIGLLLLVISMVIACKGQKNQVIDKECNCDKLIKEYIYFEQTIMVEKYYFFAPEKPVVSYADGTHTTPPINKHVSRMLHCIPSVELTKPSLQLVYRIKEEELSEWETWLKVNCEESFNKYQAEREKKTK